VKPRARIDNWFAVPSKENPQYLIGEVSGHVRQEEFKKQMQQTSNLTYVDWDNNYAETRNTRYTLGKEGELK
jgi:hypothetical protein